MEHTYTDYLFILDLYDESIPLDKLLSHIEPAGTIRPEAFMQAEEVLAEMERRGLVVHTGNNATYRIRLTAFGREVSQNIADVLADRMINSWRVQQQAFSSDGTNVANF